MADKEAVPTTPKAIVVCMYPDVCLSPDDPVPYQIVAKYSDMVDHSPDVRVTGYQATTERSYTTRCYNDDPGSGGGVRSGVRLGVCKPSAGWSSSVRTNGARTLRHDAELDMNGPGPDGPFNTKGKTVYPGGPSSKGIAADGTITKDTNPPSPDDAAEGAAAAPGEPGTLAKLWDGFQESVNQTIDMGKATVQVVYSAGHTLWDGTTGGMLFEPWELHSGVVAMEQAGDGMSALIEDPVATGNAMAEAFAADPARGLGGLLGGMATGLVGGAAPGMVRSGTGMLRGAFRKAERGLFRKRPPRLGGEGGGGDGVKITRKPWEDRENFGEGATSKSYRDGDRVHKVVKNEVADEWGREVPITDAERDFIAENTVELNQGLHEAMPDVVPDMELAEPGVMSQSFVDGRMMGDLRGDALANAQANVSQALANAHDTLGLTAGQVGDFPNGFVVRIDVNPANFRFDAAGNITGWFDPVSIVPPHGR